MLEWLQRRPGGSLLRTTKAKSHYKDGWQVVLWQERAARVLRECQPYFIVKSAQTNLAIRFMKELVSHRSRGIPGAEEVARRHAFYLESLALNRGARRPRRHEQ